jgi:hypothetical protein
MNRRGFLTAIAAAPVAIPVAVKAAVTVQSDSIFGEAILGESMTFEPLAPIDPQGGFTIPEKYHAELREMLRQWDAHHPIIVNSDPHVASQMAEHDLFDFSPTAERTG